MNPENNDKRPRDFAVDESTTARVDQQCYRVAKGETNPFDKGLSEFSHRRTLRETGPIVEPTLALLV